MAMEVEVLIIMDVCMMFLPRVSYSLHQFYFGGSIALKGQFSRQIVLVAYSIKINNTHYWSHAWLILTFLRMA